MYLHLERVGDHHCNEPHGGADTLGCSWGPPSMESAGRMDNSKVPIYTDTERRGRRGFKRKEEIKKKVFLNMLTVITHFKCLMME